MTLHATFHGGPADGTDRTYPHITRALPALWWTHTPHPRNPLSAHTALTAAEHPGDLTTLVDAAGGAYRLTGPDPHRPDVWIYTSVDLATTDRRDTIPAA